MPDDKKFEGFSQSMVDEEKVLKETTKAMDNNTAVMQRSTKAVQDHTGAWGRLRAEQETFLGKFKETMGHVRRSTNDFAGAGSAATGFFDKIKQGTTLTAMYNRKLDAMRKGQETYSATMVATTNNISSAMEKSQQYVNAVHDSYRSAHKMAGEWRVETKALQQAVDDLNARFATQIAVSGNMKGAIEDMRKEALIMSKYIGTSMQDVMDSWQERLQQNIGSLEDARNEMVQVTYQADKYAQEIQKLGDAYLKTGNIGKKEFLDLVRSVGKELKTGTIDAAGYSRAIKGLLVEGKKGLLTTNEQRESAEALKRMLDSMTKEDTAGEFWGLSAAAKVRDMWDDLSNVQDEGLRRRLEQAKIKTKDMGDVQQRRYIMSVLRGSASGNAMMLRLVAQKTGKDLTTEVVRELGGTNTMIASQMAESIQNGKLAQDFDKKAAKDSKKGQKDQVEVWKKDIGDLVKATHTPKDTEYKLIAEVERIRKYIEGWTKGGIMQSLLTQGSMIGGQMIWNKLLTGSALGMAGGGGGLFGGGAATTTAAGAAVPTAAGTGGLSATLAGGGLGAAGIALAGVAIAGTVGVAVGEAMDRGFGWAVKKGMLGERESKIAKLSGDGSLSDYIGKGLMSLSASDPGNENEGLKQIQNERVLIEGKEYERRKDRLKLLKEQIADMKKREKNLTEVERERSEAIKKQAAQIDKSISKRKKQEEKESKASTRRLNVGERKKTLKAMRQVQGGTPEEVAQQLVFARDEDGIALSRETRHDPDMLRRTIMTQFQQLSAKEQKKFGDPEEVIKALTIKTGRARILGETEDRKEVERVKNLPVEELKKLYKEKFGKDISGSAMSQYAVAQQVEANKLQKIQLDLSAGLGEIVSDVTSNAKGEMIFTMPGAPVKVKLKGLATEVGTQTQKQLSKG